MRVLLTVLYVAAAIYAFTCEPAPGVALALAGAALVIEGDLRASRQRVVIAESAENVAEHGVEIERLRADLERAYMERDAAQERAAQYERDWYAAKSEFGAASARQRARVRLLDGALRAVADAAADRERIAGRGLSASVPWSTITAAREVLDG